LRYLEVELREEFLWRKRIAFTSR